MKALQIVYNLLRDKVPELHLVRLKALMVTVEAALKKPMLSISWLGRTIKSRAFVKHRIKRVDRLVGNPHLNEDRMGIQMAVARFLVRYVAQPVVLIDWTDLTPDQEWHLLRASLPVKGRGLTLYEEVHPQSKYGNRRIQSSFLNRLKDILPKDVRPIIIGDAGFHVPFYRKVEKLGWHWIGRIEGRDYISWLAEPDQWERATDLYAKATAYPKRLGTVNWVRSNPLRADLVLWKHLPKGRKARNRMGEADHSHHSRKHAKRAQTPWLLVAAPSLGACAARQITNYYALRMQEEEGFRDTKSIRYGAGWEVSQSQDPQRIANLLLIADLATLVLWMVGFTADRRGETKHLQVNTIKNRSVLSLVFEGRTVLNSTPLRFGIKELKESIRWLGEYYQGIHAEVVTP